MRSRRPVVVALAAVALGAPLLAACGDDSIDSADTTTAPTTSAAPTSAAPTSAAPTSGPTSETTAAGSPEKPMVSIPATSPTELVVTDLTTGTGPEAKPGDVLLMHYVGVRSEDGTEFDNSYDRGSTFPLTLGAGRVIQGWDEGLVGIREGGRRQLDIPAELAYGDSPRGEVIQPGDALSFVVDAVDVISAPDPADRPELEVAPQDNVASVQTTDLVTGSGPALTGGETAVVYLSAYRADTGEELLTSWDGGVLEQLPLADMTTDLPGLVEGMIGMQAGGRRQITVPFELGFGPDGNPQLGLPANTDLVMVIDLFGMY